MDKNTLIGLLLMGLVIFGFMWLNPAPEEQPQQQTAETAAAKGDDTPATVADSINATEIDNIKSIVSQYGKAEESANGKITVLRNSTLLSMPRNSSAVSGKW